MGPSPEHVVLLRTMKGGNSQAEVSEPLPAEEKVKGWQCERDVSLLEPLLGIDV